MSTSKKRGISSFSRKSLLIAALSASALVGSAQRSENAGVSNKEKAMAILNSLETHDPAGPGYISDERYKQHNLIIADNKPGYLALSKILPADNKVHIIRAFEDGDYVFLHVEYNLWGGTAGMDIFKFKNGKAVEHWDNLQKVTAPSAAGGHTMVDGPVAATDLDKTAANKKLIRKYVREVFVEGHTDKLDEYIDGEHFIEHHPGFSDGLTGLKKGFAERKANGETFKYTAIHQVLGQGNFCLVTGEAFVAGKHTALYDLFRVENGKIAEHWDTVEEIPEEASWKNPNGKF